jgi:hypothetical protein
MTGNASRLITASVIAAAAYASAGIATAGIVVPGAQSVFKSDFSCGSLNISLAGLASVPVTCANVATHDGMVVGTFSANGTARTFLQSEHLTASVDLTANLSGEGSGTAQAEAHLIYYVGLDTVAPPPVAASQIPVIFTALAQASGTADGSFDGALGASVDVQISGFSNVSSNVNADIGQTGANALDKTDTHTGTLLFDPTEGPAIARIKLDVACAVGAGSSQGFTVGSIICAADPLVGFDQDAFDAAMGTNTFTLADYYTFVFSEGLDAPAPTVPEPTTFAVMSLGLAGLVATRRRKHRPPTAVC